jgi:hypothetical protein
MTSMTTPSEVEETTNEMKPAMPERVQMIFKELFQGLETMKQQQWKITNYGVLLLAAMWALKDKINLWVLLFAVWATFTVGFLMLLWIQRNMGRYRNRIDGIHHAYFTRTELKNIGLTECEIKTLGRLTESQQARRGWEFVAAFMVVLFVGSLLISVAAWPTAFPLSSP